MPMSYPVWGSPQRPDTLQGTRPMSSEWGPKDVSEMLQKGIGSLYDIYQKAEQNQYGKVKTREAGGEWNKGVEAGRLQQPGGPYAAPVGTGTPPPSGGFNETGKLPTFAQGPSGPLESTIRAAAARWGIDGDTAVAVARSEGGLTDPVRQSNVVKNGVREQSYGPFQLFLGGGLGNEALARGIDPRNPAHAEKAIDFAMEKASQMGWKPWYGAANAGIGQWQGIRRGQASGGQPAQTPAPTQNQPAAAPQGTPAPMQAPVPAPANLAAANPTPITQSSQTLFQQPQPQQVAAAPGIGSGPPSPGREPGGTTPIPASPYMDPNLYGMPNASPPAGSGSNTPVIPGISDPDQQPYQVAGDVVAAPRPASLATPPGGQATAPAMTMPPGTTGPGPATPAPPATTPPVPTGPGGPTGQPAPGVGKTPMPDGTVRWTGPNGEDLGPVLPGETAPGVGGKPPPPAATATTTPPPVQTAQAGGGGAIPPQIANRLGISPEAMQAANPHMLRALGLAIQAGDPGMVQAIAGGINAVTASSTAKGAANDMQMVVQPGDAAMRQRFNLPDDGQSYTVTLNGATGQPKQISPISEKSKQEDRTYAQQEGLSKDVTGNPEYKAYTAGVQMLPSLKAVFDQGNPQGDLAAIFQFMKSLDPGSAVQAGEQAAARDTGGVYGGMWSLYNKAMGKGGLNSEQRQQFYNTAVAAVQGKANAARSVVDFNRNKAKGYGLNPDMVAPVIGEFPKDITPVKRIKDPATGKMMAPFPNRDQEGNPTDDPFDDSTKDVPGSSEANPIPVKTEEDGDLLKAGKHYVLPDGNLGVSDGSMRGKR